MFISINACLILENGSYFFGSGVGKEEITTSDVCFNTAMTGYQEVLSDPSYAGQIITFGFPHIGNVEENDQDMEAKKCFLKGVILKDRISAPSNHRSKGHLNDWLRENEIIGISQVDTRAIIKTVRNYGPLKGLIYHSSSSPTLKDLSSLRAILDKEQGIEHKDFSSDVATKDVCSWTNKGIQDNKSNQQEQKHIVIIDFGVKRGIIQALERNEYMITLLPPHSTYEDILAQNPEGIILSNGPGDSHSIASYVTPVIHKLLTTKIPIFGICLGHRLLGLALGGTVRKMITGHHGINHPVKFWPLEERKSDIHPHQKKSSSESARQQRLDTQVSDEGGHLYRLFAEIKIKGKKLIVDVNSEQQANIVEDFFQDQLSSLLGEPTRLKPELRDSEDSSEELVSGLSTEEEEKFIQQMLDQHYREWIDSPLPFLNHKTPRQSVKTKNGLGKVIELLKDMENTDMRAVKQGNRAMPYNFNWVYSELGIAARDLL